MTMLLITGDAGTGKSNLLAACKHTPGLERLHLIDPLGDEHLRWTAPDPRRFDVVAFDHAEYLANLPLQIAAAHAWCKRHDKPLWVVHQDRRSLERLGVDICGSAIEMRLEGYEAGGGLTFSAGGARRSFALAELQDLVRALVPSQGDGGIGYADVIANLDAARGAALRTGRVV